MEKKLKCQLSNCQWSGCIIDLLYHCLAEHKDYVLEVDEESALSFTMDNITKDTFLLVGMGGIYWFLLDTTENLCRRGIFAIGKSDLSEFMMKVGEIGDEKFTYMGPIKVQHEGSDQYDLEWTHSDIARLTEEGTLMSMVMPYAGFDWEDVYMDAYIDVLVEENQLDGVMVENQLNDRNYVSWFDEDFNEPQCTMCCCKRIY